MASSSPVTLYRAVTSFGSRGRDWPGASPCSSSDPSLTLTSRSTLCPRASNILRTSRLRPSRMTTPTAVRPARPSDQTCGKRSRGTVVEGDAGRQSPDLGAGDRRGQFDQVLLFHAVPRVLEAVGQLTVVRQDDQPLGLPIEPAHGKEPGARRHELGDRSFGVAVPHRRGDADRLVEREVSEFRMNGHGLTVHGDASSQGVDLITKPGQVAIDLNPPFTDKILEPGASSRSPLEPALSAGVPGCPAVGPHRDVEGSWRKRT